MALLIGVPKETAAGEKRVATVPDVVEKLIKLGFTVAVQSGAGDAANFSDDAYRAAGAEVAADGRRALGPERHRLQGARPDRGRSRPDARRQHAGQLHLAGAEPRADAAARGAEGDRAGDRRVPRSSRARRRWTRCPHGQHQRLPRRDRGGQRVRPLLHRPDHRRRQGAAGQGLHHRRRRRRPGRDRHRRRAWAPSCAPTTRAPRWPTRSSRWAASSSKVDYEEEGSGGGGYAKVMSEGFQKAQREMYAKQAKEVDIIITTALIPGKPAPKLITAEMVQVDEAGQRHRRHGGRAGRQLRADRAGRGRGQARRHHHRLHRPAEPPGQAGVARCTRPTCCA